jgi:hypothetical protein
MRTTDSPGEELERLVDRHIELSELFVGAWTSGPRAAPLPLVTMTGGKAFADCLADLVDRALVAYEGAGFPQDSTILALKFALVETIVDSLDRGAAGRGTPR